MAKDRIVTFSIATIIILLWGSTWYFLGSEKPDVRGTFGDMFGAVNALFSGFAFLGVIYAILLQKTELSLQRQELKLTREELNLTREELKKSADAQEKSEKSLSIQAKAMEQTALINLLTISIQSLASRVQGISLSGESSVVENNVRRRDVLLRKHAAATLKLDSLLEEIVGS